MNQKNSYLSIDFRKLGLYFVLLVLAFSLYATVAPNKARAAVNAKLSLTPASGSISQNGNLVLSLNLDSGGNSNDVWQADLIYSTANISSVSISIPAASPFDQAPTADVTSGGVINFSRFTFSPSTYSGPIATITLTTKATGAGAVTFTHICGVADPDPCTAVVSGGTNNLASTTNAAYTVTPQDVCGSLEQTLPYVLSYYNPKSYDHYYTAYRCETYTLVNKLGYKLDGAEFNTTDPATVPGAVPVWRLYNPKTAQHLWTVSQADINNATQHAGYYLEGIAFYSAPSNASGVHIVWRLYNPKTYQHIWTPSQNSITFATQKLGFYVEGIAFYSQ